MYKSQSLLCFIFIIAFALYMLMNELDFTSGKSKGNKHN